MKRTGAELLSKDGLETVGAAGYKYSRRSHFAKVGFYYGEDERTELSEDMRALINGMGINEPQHMKNWAMEELLGERNMGPTGLGYALGAYLE